MSGSVTFRQRINRIVCFREFRLYKYVWKKLSSKELDQSLAVPYFIEKFGDL